MSNCLHLFVCTSFVTKHRELYFTISPGYLTVLQHKDRLSSLTDRSLHSLVTPHAVCFQMPSMQTYFLQPTEKKHTHLHLTEQK